MFSSVISTAAESMGKTEKFPRCNNKASQSHYRIEFPQEDRQKADCKWKRKKKLRKCGRLRSVSTETSLTKEKRDTGWGPEEKAGSRSECVFGGAVTWWLGHLNMLATKEKEPKKKKKENTVEREMGGWDRMLKGDEQREPNFGRTAECHLASPLFFPGKETKFLI